MIDPKLNELDTKSKSGEPETNAANPKPRPGLSINDTVASNANLSVGSRGTDTSGVRSGSGAGAGGVLSTPAAAGESPAPNVTPGNPGTGTTPRGSVAETETQTTAHGRTDDTSIGTDWTHDDVATRAYENWHARGCPHGSPEEDWHRAERELRERRAAGKTSAASA